MHRKREVPGKNSVSIYFPELHMFISHLLFNQFSLEKKEIYLKSEPTSIFRKDVKCILM